MNKNNHNHSHATIRIQNDDVSIELPVAALEHYDEVMSMARMVVLGTDSGTKESVQGDPGLTALQRVKEALDSSAPLSALKNLKVSVDGRDSANKSRGVNAEEKLKLEKEKFHHMVLEAAQSMGITVSPGAQTSSVIGVIKNTAKRAQSHLTQIEELLENSIRDMPMRSCHEKGVSGAYKNIAAIVGRAKEKTELLDDAFDAYRELLVVFAEIGIEIPHRHGETLAQSIRRSSEAIRVAARRGDLGVSAMQGVKEGDE